MKRFLVTISFLSILTISGLSQADTISFWHVYLDSKEIADFSVISENPKVEINTTDLNKNSILTVKYFRDTPCQSCHTYITICNSKDNTIFKIKGSGTLNRHDLKLKRLIKMYSSGKASSFRFYFKEPPFQAQYLFTLTFKK